MGFGIAVVIALTLVNGLLAMSGLAVVSARAARTHGDGGPLRSWRSGRPAPGGRSGALRAERPDRHHAVGIFAGAESGATFGAGWVAT